jgi:RHS repeat-associated protein
MTEQQFVPPSTQSSAGQHDASNSPFTPPQISLPKGGGAIRGIGEKISANPITGTGSLSVPIGLTPGRSGFTPQLALSYDSGMGNGPFGIGWSLSHPSITRKTDKGLPQYRDSEDSDVFILSDAEDLVPVLTQNAFGDWINEETQCEGYCIRLYRPRVEGLFARIERWTRLADGDVYWRSISKDNIVTFYGLDSDSRICDPENASHIFSWLVCQSFDSTGNGIIYDHTSESDFGIDPCRANERNRQRTANRYLKRVKYGNRHPLLLDPTTKSFRRSRATRKELESASWMFEVVFDYGETHYREAPADERRRVFATADLAGIGSVLGPVRRDPFSTYRSAFEVRTYRLCHRILVFHHFPDELGVRDYLVRSTAVEYQQKELGSFLTKVTQSGYKRQADGRYLKKSLPSLEVQYLPSPLEDVHNIEFRVEEVTGDALDNLPEGIDGSRYRWVDIDGEGISGVLSEQANSWFYKANCGNGSFAAVETISPKPSLSGLSSGQMQLMDLAGDGNLDLVELEQPSPGFYERTVDAGWQGFRTFRDLPVRDWKDPNLRFVDLTGDGIADILVTEDEVIWWHGSRLTEGFSEAKCVFIPHDEEQGPRVVFSDAAQSIYLADMSGDGMSDIVRIRNGEVCYWPNLGYGRFGAKVTMDNAPWFDEPDLFNQRRVHLTDTDGSGTTDIVYFASDAVRIFLNQSGNSWSQVRELKGFPATSDITNVSVVDFLGRGTACMVWSSALPGDARRPLRYVDLMCGRKPHLLHRMVNNLGAETSLVYAASTEFYLADKAAGRPWLTRLPFPVHVVQRVETIDRMSRNRFTTRYTYHHGYFDGVEREFRGFGRVEQLDAEEFGALGEARQSSPWLNESPVSQLPPTLTKTWFHTGVYLDGRGISRHMENEYYIEGRSEFGESPMSREKRAAMLLEDTILPSHLTPEEAREACRSLKGSTLRQEIYTLDHTKESCRPYTVSERNFTIQPLQPRGTNLHAVFFMHPRESLSFSYERKLYYTEGGWRADPRVAHSVVLRVDDYGNVVESVSIGYGRRFADPSPLLGHADHAKQKEILITLTENQYTNTVLDASAYRAPALSASCTYELTTAKPQSEERHVTNLFRLSEILELIWRASQPGHEIPFEDTKGEGASVEGACRRLIKRNRNLFRSNDLSKILAIGELESLALPGQNYSLALSAGVLAKVYCRPRTDGTIENLLPDPASVLSEEGKYFELDSDGQWWIPTGRFFYSPHNLHEPAVEFDYAVRHFFLPHRYRDPFGNVTHAEFDVHDLVVIGTRDPLGNSVQAKLDYRVVSPQLMTDPNGNRSEVAFDALGLVVGIAVMGKHGENLGDSLEGFVPDLDEETIFEHIKRPFINPHEILAKATSRLVYDLSGFERTQTHVQPQSTVVYTLTRETHDSDLGPHQQTKIQHAFSYSDGFERIIQKKAQAEPGPLAGGGLVVKPRWAASGWTIFNNKGKPVRQYEPFFSATQEFEFAQIVGVSSILIYDSAERVVATLHPEHTFEKVIFDPWSQTTWDMNDTVLQSNPADDADVGSFIARIPRSDYLPSWYEQRISGDLGPGERAAAEKAAVHSFTPATTFVDSMGRSFLAFAHNRFLKEGVAIEEFFATRTEFDIQGNQLSVTDALGRKIMSYDYDMMGTKLHQNSVDAGERWTLNEVRGKPIRTWDSRNHELRYKYDELRRPTDLFVANGQGLAKLVERAVYGEGQADELALNLRVRIFQQLDGAGIITNHRYDFKGNLLQSSRQLLLNYRDPEVDWSESPSLEARNFVNKSSYDALNRIVTSTLPDASTIRPHFDVANLLDRVDVSIRDSATPTRFVTEIAYNAKGQREFIAYGNSARTDYEYDPLTFRLRHLKTTRQTSHAVLQDLKYHYDPVGNITLIQDQAQETLFFKNQVVTPSNSYVYDAVYRLISADGREHIGQLADPQISFEDAWRANRPLPDDGHAMRRYREEYRYDGVGNIRTVVHTAANGSWTRHYSYGESHSHPANNRLMSTAVGSVQEPYSYDADGNITRMPHLPEMEWNFKDQLHATRRQVVKEEGGQKTYYVYSSTGQRVRKTTERSEGNKAHERIYLPGYELYQEYAHNAAVKLERVTVHIMDDKRRVALVETKTIDEKSDESTLPETLIRYQFGNHLDSSTLELDDSAAIISFEEFYIFGSSSFESVRNAVEVSPKRYRYAGKERDEETELYYHGARYCASWLGRWISCDPAGMADGTNLYAYSRNNPVSLRDPYGTDAETSQAEDEANACLVDPSAPQPTAMEEQQQASIPSEHPQTSSAPPPATTEKSPEPAPAQWEVGPRGEHLPTADWTGGSLRDPSEYDKPMAMDLERAGYHEAAELAQNYLCASCHILTKVDPAEFSIRGYSKGWQRAYVQGFVEVPLMANPVGGAWEVGVSAGQAMTGESSGLHISNISNVLVDGRSDIGRTLTTKERLFEAGGAAIGGALMGFGAASEFAGNEEWFGARGAASGRDFDPASAGGPIRALSTEGVKVTPRGIAAVEQHLARFGADEANEAMVARLRGIAAGDLEPTASDLNFYTHELRESVRYRRLGFPTGNPGHEVWNNAHTATLEDYGLTPGPGVLYHPSISQ